MKSDTQPRMRRYAGELISIIRSAGLLWKLTPRLQRWTLMGGILLMVLGGAANTAVPLLLGKLVDSVPHAPAIATGTGPEIAAETTETVAATSPAAVRDASAPPSSDPMHPLAFYLAMIGLAYLARETLQVGRRMLVEYTCTQLEKHLFVRIVSHLLMSDLSALSKEKIGTVHGRMLRNIGGSVRFFRVAFLDFLPALVVGGFALTAVFVKGPWVGLVMVAVLPVSIYVTLRQLLSQKGVRLELMHSRDELDGTVVEQLEGIDYIRTANTHRQETRRVARAAEKLRARQFGHQCVMALFGSGKALLEGFFHILVVGTAVYLAAQGRISVGDILMFSMLFLNVMSPLAEVHRMIDEGHESSLLVGELIKMLREPVDRCYQIKEVRQPVLDCDPVIVVDELAVDYTPGEGNRRRALDGVSLAIRRGEIIGIAGKSGCGKSTFLRALLRLVHPSDGSAVIGGIPLDALDRENMASLIGYVGQSPFVFSSSVEDNIAYERVGARLEEIRNAARLAGIEDEILEIPGGFSAVISERGQSLSGGQKQRLALARVILKDPPILILDEATSALDTISEGRIQEWLISARGKRTVILVAHRLSTLLHTDRILVFDNGRIVETGTYDELVLQGGLFTHLVESAEAHTTNGHAAQPIVLAAG